MCKKLCFPVSINEVIENDLHFFYTSSSEKMDIDRFSLGVLVYIVNKAKIWLVLLEFSPHW